MKATRLLALAAVLITSQAYALTAAQKNSGCPPDIQCPSNNGSSGAGGGDYGPSGFMGSFSDGKGGTVDFYNDAGGEWWVENHSDGTSQVGWDEEAGPKMLKKFPKQPGVKRPTYAKAQMTSAAKKSLAAAQQKAAADKAAADKAAADKAAADKLAADKAAALKAANYSGPPVSANPVAGVTPAARKKP